MALSFIPTKQQIVTVASALLIIAVVMKVLPIPDTYKQWFRV